jgi:hypothetical protein
VVELFANNPVAGIIVGILASFLFSQLVVVITEYYLRWKRFRQAHSFASRRGKPLLIIGRPGSPLRLYGCGDVCIDIDPRVVNDCPECGLVADIKKIPFGDRYFGAVFCSHILEYLPSVAEAEKAVREMERVAERIFICHTLRWNLLWRYFSIAQVLWVSSTRGKITAKERPW